MYYIFSIKVRASIINSVYLFDRCRFVISIVVATKIVVTSI